MDNALDMARTVLEVKKFDTVSNCQSMARRMLQFQLESIAPKIIEGITGMHGFFLNSYKGLGCTVCNANSHKGIDIAKKEFKLGEGFCRDLTSNSLHVLVYLHIHFKKLYNLISNFVSKCDMKGVFTEANNVPAEASMKIDKVRQKDLESCVEFRNDKGWLSACGNICGEFNVAKFSEYFHPDLKAYHIATTFLKTKLKELGETKKDKGKKDDKKKKDEGKDDKKTPKKTKKQERILSRLKIHRDIRLLSDNKEAAKKEETPKAGDDKAKEGDDKAKDGEDEKEKTPEPPAPKTFDEKIADSALLTVFRTAPEEAKALMDLKIHFAEHSPNPHNIGMTTKFDDETYATVKTAMEAPKEGEEGKEGVEGVEGAEPVDKTKEEGGDAATEKKESGGLFGGAERLNSILTLTAMFVMMLITQ